jgi:hypothetical protein
MSELHEELILFAAGVAADLALVYLSLIAQLLLDVASGTSRQASRAPASAIPTCAIEKATRGTDSSGGAVSARSRPDTALRVLEMITNIRLYFRPPRSVWVWAAIISAVPDRARAQTSPADSL